MSGNTGFEALPDRVIVDMVTSLEMPIDDVSPRTQAARNVGALFMLDHLVKGDWDPSGQAIMQEFLQRLVANAARHGIMLEPVTTES